MADCRCYIHSDLSAGLPAGEMERIRALEPEEKVAALTLLFGEPQSTLGTGGLLLTWGLEQRRADALADL